MSRRASFWIGNSYTAETVYVYVDYEPKNNEYLKDVDYSNEAVKNPVSMESKTF